MKKRKFDKHLVNHQNKSNTPQESFQYVYQFEFDETPEPTEMEKPLFLHLSSGLKKFLTQQSRQSSQSMLLFNQLQPIPLKEQS